MICKIPQEYFVSVYQIQTVIGMGPACPCWTCDCVMWMTFISGLLFSHLFMDFCKSLGSFVQNTFTFVAIVFTASLFINYSTEGICRG
jgi:hypothetical protein